MHDNKRLFLYEEIMLLSLRDREGTVEPAVSYREALGGAVLAELLLDNYIELELTKRSKPVRIVKTSPVGDTLLDECLEKIKAVKRKKSAQEWVLRFSNMRHLKNRIALSLCNKGILTESEDKILLFFTRKVYPEVNPEPEREILERIERAVLSEDSEIDPRSVVLISLAYHSGLLKRSLNKEIFKSRKKRIKKIISGETAGKAVADAIQAMQAAAAIAAIIPAMSAVSTAS